MEEKSLVDLFKLYDYEFDKVCKDLRVKNTPSWRDRWLYRFMSINPIYKFFPYEIFLTTFYSDKKIIEEKRKLVGKLKKEKEIIYDKNLSESLKFFFYPTIFLSPKLYKNFSEWWFHCAKDFLYKTPKVEVLNFFKEGYYFKNFEPNFSQEKLKKLWMESNETELQKIQESASYTFTLLVPTFGNRTKILNEIKSHLKNLNNESENFLKSKISKKTVLDSFSLLETIVQQGNIELLTLADRANILEISRMNISNLYGKSSIDSVRSGTSRLKNIAKKIFEASSYGVFPFFDEKLMQRNDYVEFFLKNNPDLLSIESFNLLRKNLPDPEDMYKVIKNDLISLGNVIYES